eukprot:13048721-Heterocapsa_arctica.AAC.1
MQGGRLRVGGWLASWLAGCLASCLRDFLLARVLTATWLVGQLMPTETAQLMAGLLPLRSS